jgi:hypothetical protein
MQSIGWLSMFIYLALAHILIAIAFARGLTNKVCHTAARSAEGTNWRSRLVSA